MFGIDPFTILTAFIPLLTSTVSRIVDHFTGGASPQTVQEQIELNNSEVARMQAIAQIDTPSGNSARWVNTIRDALRPMVAYIVLGLFSTVTIYYSVTGQVNTNYLLDILSNLTSCVIFYLFGHEMQVKLDK